MPNLQKMQGACQNPPPHVMLIKNGKHRQQNMPNLQKMLGTYHAIMPLQKMRGELYAIHLKVQKMQGTMHASQMLQRKNGK